MNKKTKTHLRRASRLQAPFLKDKEKTVSFRIFWNPKLSEIITEVSGSETIQIKTIYPSAMEGWTSF